MISVIACLFTQASNRSRFVTEHIFSSGNMYPLFLSVALRAFCQYGTRLPVRATHPNFDPNTNANSQHNSNPNHNLPTHPNNNPKTAKTHLGPYIRRKAQHVDRDSSFLVPKISAKFQRGHYGSAK